MLPLGTSAPDFSLPDTTSGATVLLGDFADRPVLLVMFICNHCPYVLHTIEEISRIGRDYGERGVAVVAISSNDADQYPADGPEAMATFAEQHGFTFPYLYDESQTVAAAYHANCTPDPFVFDAQRQLVYRGRIDGSRPGNDEPTDGADLRAALDAAIAGTPVAGEQVPSAGCGIKWKPGNEPTYVISLG
jgi:peroxiredoxin